MSKTNHMHIVLRRIALLGLAFTFTIGLSGQDIGSFLKKAKDVVEGNGSLSADEMSGGLKEALQLGVGEAVDRLSAENGYLESPYKILLPEEARQVVDKLKMVPGFTNVEQELIQRVNRAAELAAREATPIFTDAITQMTFRDAADILTGEQDAATQYLHRSTHDKLFTAFEPIVIDALDEVNARTYWREATTAYNRLPFVRRVETELDDYVTEEALSGLFGLIEKKESEIRTDIGSRTSPLLKKVFAQQDN